MERSKQKDEKYIENYKKTTENKFRSKYEKQVEKIRKDRRTEALKIAEKTIYSRGRTGIGS